MDREGDESMSATPGPWKYSFEAVDPEWAVVTAKGGLIIANVNSNKLQEANAALIAASPVLLAACKEALEGLIVTLRDAYKVSDEMIEKHPTVILLRAVIAKAEPAP
jgi:hypothetical protein